VAHIRIASPAERDLRALRRLPDLQRIQDAIDALRREDQGLDIRPLEGRAPWRRLRDGNWRIIFRPLNADEVRDLGLRGRVYVVARVVNRRDLERAARGL